MNKNKGFTLIELLVVIAIIGILASVVLASLSSARDKGKDAAVKSQLASMKAQAELYYANNSESYAGVCAGAQSGNGFGGTFGPGLFYAAYASSGSATSIETPVTSGGSTDALVARCIDSADTWVVTVPLATSAGTLPVMYCSDNTGLSREVTSNIVSAATACPTL